MRACAELPLAKIVIEKILCFMCNDNKGDMDIFFDDKMYFKTEWGICTLVLLI